MLWISSASNESDLFWTTGEVCRWLDQLISTKSLLGHIIDWRRSPACHNTAQAEGTDRSKKEKNTPILFKTYLTVFIGAALLRPLGAACVYFLHANVASCSLLTAMQLCFLLLSTVLISHLLTLVSRKAKTDLMSSQRILRECLVRCTFLIHCIWWLDIFIYHHRFSFFAGDRLLICFVCLFFPLWLYFFF